MEFYIHFNLFFCFYVSCNSPRSRSLSKSIINCYYLNKMDKSLRNVFNKTLPVTWTLVHSLGFTIQNYFWISIHIQKKQIFLAFHVCLQVCFQHILFPALFSFHFQRFCPTCTWRRSTELICFTQGICIINYCSWVGPSVVWKFGNTEMVGWFVVERRIRNLYELLSYQQCM